MDVRRRSTCMSSLIVVVGIVLMMMMNTTEGQTSDPPSCAAQLVPCADFLNSKKPPSSCCDPLKKTVETQLKCLCDLFYSPGFLQSLNINTTSALQLSRNCGVTTDLTTCKQGGSAPPPTAGAPPAKDGGDKGAAGRVSFTGFSSLLLLVSMLFN
ncbi:non-specific lipid transfer protein GPI-anchored 7-like [Cicer arietinum]|uniref:Protein YLS3-like n=1 Tax=Cicer arietinum TaxID=3827 RepID=A0A1S2Z643_CICAR|nr:protein YLS3-like [Cicer arietinum]